MIKKVTVNSQIFWFVQTDGCFYLFTGDEMEKAANRYWRLKEAYDEYIKLQKQVEKKVKKK